MDKDYYNVKFISIGSTYSGTVLTLASGIGEASLCICIGEAEAQSITISLKKIEVPRPMTHDLTLKMLDLNHCQIEKVLITHLDMGIYFSEIHLRHRHGMEIIDARPSDAVALAIRCRAPILFHKDLVSPDITDWESHHLRPALDCPGEDKLRAELIRKLNNAIEHENFEVAAILRDEVKELDR